MKEVKFYRCPRCGKVVERLVDGKGIMVCCGVAMEELEAKMDDGAVEKHVPILERKDGKLLVRVGEVAHPMEKEHYIAFIMLVTDEMICRYDLKPGDEARCVFDDVSHGVVYEYCNKHGLWKKKF